MLQERDDIRIPKPKPPQFQSNQPLQSRFIVHFNSIYCELIEINDFQLPNERVVYLVPSSEGVRPKRAVSPITHRALEFVLQLCGISRHSNASSTSKILIFRSDQIDFTTHERLHTVTVNRFRIALEWVGMPCQELNTILLKQQLNAHFNVL